MASMTEITCRCGCGRKKMVRTADVKRGWGKYFSKSCKARHQTRRTGYSGPKLTTEERDHEYAIESMDAGWDGHKGTF